MTRPKVYDRAYFDKWYRGRRHAVWQRADLVRQVTFAVAAAEMVLAQPIASVLDLGAGEGRWQPVLRRLRPGASYLGIDSSEWAVRRWGKARNLRLGRIDQASHADIRGRYDLLIAADVLHYLPAESLRRAARLIARHTGAVAYLPAFVPGDAMVGDRQEFQPRSAAAFRRVFTAAGLVELGMALWTTKRWARHLAALERPAAAGRF